MQYLGAILLSLFLLLLAMTLGGCGLPECSSFDASDKCPISYCDWSAGACKQATFKRESDGSCSYPIQEPEVCTHVAEQVLGLNEVYSHYENKVNDVLPDADLEPSGCYFRVFDGDKAVLRFNRLQTKMKCYFVFWDAFCLCREEKPRASAESTEEEVKLVGLGVSAGIIATFVLSTSFVLGFRAEGEGICHYAKLVLVSAPDQIFSVYFNIWCFQVSAGAGFKFFAVMASLVGVPYLVVAIIILGGKSKGESSPPALRFVSGMALLSDIFSVIAVASLDIANAPEGKLLPIWMKVMDLTTSVLSLIAEIVTIMIAC